MTTPNGIRTESTQTPFASIDTRYVTSRDSTFRHSIQDQVLHLTVGAALRAFGFGAIA